MKQLIFLLLFPSLAMAQYQGNANQKITLGEQTTADGLVYRGVLNDTALITPLSDTSAYIILDTVNNRFYNYNRSTNVWSVAGGGTAVTSITGGTGLTGGTITTSGTLAADTSFLFTQSDTLSLNLTSRLASKLNIADTTNMLLPYFRDADTTTLNLTSRFAAKQNNITLTTTGTSGAATLTGATLNIPQYSGGGGVDSTAIKYVNTYGAQTVNGAKTFTSVVTGTRFDPTANTVTGNGMYLPATNSLGFSTAGTQRIHINSAGKVGIATQMTTANNYGIFNVAGDMTFENNFFALRANGSTDDYAQFLLRESGTSGNFGTGETGQLEFLTYSGNNNIGALAIGTIQSRPVIFATNSSERVRVKGDGEMNIGYGATDNGAYPLQVNGQIFATNATIATSDEKFKENITPLNKGLEIVNKLKPVTFNFISDTKNNFSEYEEVGFIAQDVDRALSTETFAKSIVKSADDSEPTSTMGLATQNLIPILVKAIQEQNALIKALEQRIINLENK